MVAYRYPSLNDELDVSVCFLFFSQIYALYIFFVLRVLFDILFSPFDVFWYILSSCVADCFHLFSPALSFYGLVCCFLLVVTGNK